MKLIRVKRDSYDADLRQDGLAIIELAICLPLLVGLFLCLVDLGLGLDTYFRFVQVARDAAALGVHLDGLVVGSVCQTQTTFRSNGDVVVSPGGSGCADAKQLLIHDRANTLAALFPRWIAGFEQVSRVDAAAGSAPWPTIHYAVTAHYRSLLLSQAGGVGLRIQAVGSISDTGAKLGLSAADETMLRGQFNLGSCQSITPGTVLSQGLLINLANTMCTNTPA